MDSPALPPANLSVSSVLRRDAFALTLDLRLVPGEVVGLTGGIGSGKTSTLWLVAGRLRAADGLVTFGDSIWDEPSTSTFCQQRPVALMSQAYRDDLAEDLTGTQLVAHNIERLAGPDHQPERTARTTLAGLGVGDHVVDRLPWTFSGAEAQRVALAKAVAPRAPVLLLDEPFGALDKRTGAAVRQWLTGWFADYRGIAVVASTRIDHLETFCDRIVSLDS